MPAAAIDARRFHFGLTVSNLDRAVDFYRILLGAEPRKQLDDYAKFDVADPPIVLALHPGPRHSAGALNHVGFRVASSATLVAIQERLELQGIRTQREEGVECCYALQTKFWVPDLDGNLWEIYALHQDLEHSGFGGDGAGMPPAPKVVTGRVTWEHFLTTPPPERIPHDDETVDEVILEGLFNAALERPRRMALLAEIKRVLVPGGTVRAHGLVANRPFPGEPKLPGPASMVKRIPVETEAADELTAAGFAAIHYDRFSDIHCFGVEGIELRELRISARKLEQSVGNDRHFVIYLGPQQSVTDDAGYVYPRGTRVAVDEATWRLFREEPFQDQFTCLRCAEVAAPLDRAR